MKKLLLILTLALPLPAYAITLAWPVACTLGKDCLIQNYPDRDPTGGMKDYRCGEDVYEDKHDGVDIRLRDLATMRKGVAVLAAADGTVWRIRDGMEDIAHTGGGTNQQDCGNAVIVNRDDGYQLIYCHLRKGSVRVKPGDKVITGQTLGLIGQSGFANFPHLHFAVRAHGKRIDPFDGRELSEPCSSTPAAGLWATPIAYQPTALIHDGITDSVPQKLAVRDTPPQPAALGTSAPMLAYWFEIMSTRVGDRLTLSLKAPDGTVLAEKTDTLTKSSPFYFGYIGKRFHAPVPPGTYRANLSLMRGAVEVVKAERSVAVR